MGGREKAPMRGFLICRQQALAVVNNSVAMVRDLSHIALGSAVSERRLHAVEG